jgi:hypothetical protein
MVPLLCADARAAASATARTIISVMREVMFMVITSVARLRNVMVNASEHRCNV